MGYFRAHCLFYVCYSRAHLVSEQFGPTDKGESGGPLCLRFWTHMFGNGIGSLNVFVRQDGMVFIISITGGYKKTSSILADQ
jgi:hypothetical protein